MKLLLPALLLHAGCAAKDAENPGADSEPDTAACARGTLEGNANIHTASDLASIAGYTAINGGLTISDTSIDSLAGLECLTAVTGGLSIVETDALVNLDGLRGLTQVAWIEIGGMSGDAEIRGNAALTNLDGLAGLTGAVESIEIRYNDQLTDLDPLRGLSSTAALSIGSNPSLADLNGLATLSLTDPSAELRIRDNAVLPTCAVEALLERFRSEGWVGEAVVSGNDDAASCE